MRCSGVQRVSDHEPVEMLPALTAAEASRMVDLEQVYCVARIGSSGPWSFIVEPGGSEGCFLDPQVSSGAEVLIFDPQPDHPPSQFRCHRDGQVVINSSLSGAERLARGEQPLARAMERAEENEDEPEGQVRGLLRVIGEHFDLSLPRTDIVHGALPAAVTRTSAPRSW